MNSREIDQTFLIMSGKIFISCLLGCFFIMIPPSPSTAATSQEFEVEATQTPSRLQTLIDPKPNSDFPTWVGADAATSIKISENRYVWLFGDTIIGSTDGEKRDYSVFIHNSIGVTHRQGGGNFGNITKYYNSSDNRYRGIFPANNKEEFYWPLVGAEFNSELIIAASKVSTKNTDTFKIIGTALFKINNPDDKPTEWNYTTKYLPRDGKIIWGNTLLVNDNWFYIYGNSGSGYNAKTVLSRIKTTQAKKGQWSKRLYWNNGKWKSDARPSPIEGLPGTSEATVNYNSFFGWYTLQIPPLSFDVHLYTAEKLAGPWKDQGVVYKIPSPWSTEQTSKGEPVFIAYATKSHPELATKENQIVFTYNANLDPFVHDLTGKLKDYIGREKYIDLYIPQFVSIELNRKISQ